MEIPEEVQEFKPTDERGRIYLGSEYADKRVKVAIVEVEEKYCPMCGDQIGDHDRDAKPIVLLDDGQKVCAECGKEDPRQIE